jgi:pyruvate formate lyase activating enzyme
MQIGGLIKLSLVDYPGKPAAVVFAQGCNFRCPYCYNKELVIPSCFQRPIEQEEVISFLVKRKGLLRGVVISGGEPTLQNDLLDFIRSVKQLGYSVKLDTNGSRPDVLQKAIDQSLLDFIAMDIKASLESYEKLVGVSIDQALIEKSIFLIKNSGLEHQFRTTLVKSLSQFQDLSQILRLIGGEKSYVIQNFSPRESVLDPQLVQSGAFSQEEFENIIKNREILRL